MATYHQFCPVAKAMELLDERWTLLVVRELVSGSRHFNELRRGVPRMSPALLTKRLRRLERAGIIERGPLANRVDYVLTEAGRELQPVVEAPGRWGIRWIGDLGIEDLDPQLLLWDMYRNVDLNAVPPGRNVTLPHMIEIWRGDREWATALRSGVLNMQGTTAARRAVPRWFTLSAFAKVPRPLSKTG